MKTYAFFNPFFKSHGVSIGVTDKIKLAGKRITFGIGWNISKNGNLLI